MSKVQSRHADSDTLVHLIWARGRVSELEAVLERIRRLARAEDSMSAQMVLDMINAVIEEDRT